MFVFDSTYNSNFIRLILWKIYVRNSREIYIETYKTPDLHEYQINYCSNNRAITISCVLSNKRCFRNLPFQ